MFDLVRSSRTEKMFNSHFSWIHHSILHFNWRFISAFGAQYFQQLILIVLLLIKIPNELSMWFESVSQKRIRKSHIEMGDVWCVAFNKPINQQLFERKSERGKEGKKWKPQPMNKCWTIQYMFTMKWNVFLCFELSRRETVACGPRHNLSYVSFVRCKVGAYFPAYVAH